MNNALFCGGPVCYSASAIHVRLWYALLVDVDWVETVGPILQLSFLCSQLYQRHRFSVMYYVIELPIVKA